MDFIRELLSYINPKHLIAAGGDYAMWVVAFIVFAETGLLIGFFLPGDSLLFVSGLFVSTGLIHSNTLDRILGPEYGTAGELVFMIILLSLAAIVGNYVGYAFGKRVGPRLFTRDDSVIFKKKYLDMTQSFYERNGGPALILGRFVPIIRTFVPILAGAIKMDFSRFMVYNVVGALLWVPSITIAGYFLGQIEWVEKNVEIIIIGLVIVTIIPVIRTYIREKRHADNKIKQADINNLKQIEEEMER